MKKLSLTIVMLLWGAANLRSEYSTSFYIDNNDELINLPASAAMVGADLSLTPGPHRSVHPRTSF